MKFDFISSFGSIAEFYWMYCNVAIGKPERQCAKLPTVAASSNRDHTPQSLYYCLL